MISILYFNNNNLLTYLYNIKQKSFFTSVCPYTLRKNPIKINEPLISYALKIELTEKVTLNHKFC